MTRRRNFLAVTALGAVALIPVGCGGSDDDSSGSGTDPADWVATTPAATGDLDSLVWALPYGEPTTLNWLQTASYSENTVLAPLCESLMRMTPELTYEPGLAESVDNPDPTTYVYNLRDGVTFTDGSALTAEDAAFSLNRNLDPDQGSFWTPWYENVESIEATGPLTVTVKLSQPDVLFPQFMATAAGVVAKKAYVEEKGADYGTPKGGVMCTGPYALSDWKVGDSITIERNDTYWDTENAAKTAKITFPFITNPSTLSAALSSGEADGSFEAPITLADNPGAGSVTLGNSTQLSQVYFTAKPGPVQDVRIREALSLALDRAAISQTIFKGTAAPTLSSFPPASWGYAKGVFEEGVAALPDADAADTTAAAALVEEYGEVRELSVLVNADDAAATQLATYLQSQAESIGIPVKIVALPAAQQIAAAFDPERQKQYDMNIANSSYIDIPDPLAWVYLTLTDGAPFNYIGYSDPEVNRLAEQARGTEDPEARAELLNQISAKAFGVDYPYLTVAYFAERLYMGEGITGAPASLPGYIYYPWARDVGAAG